MIADHRANILVEQIQPRCEPIPPELQAYFTPAVGCLYEWRDYWVECPGADVLHVGTESCLPLWPGLFNLRFEHQLGLTALQPFAGGRPLVSLCYVGGRFARVPQGPAMLL